jgi:hypothetical protein
MGREMRNVEREVIKIERSNAQPLSPECPWAPITALEKSPNS